MTSKNTVHNKDQFEFRVNAFRETILRQYNELLSENQSVGGGKQSYLNQILHNLQTQCWDNNHRSDKSEDTSLFASLLEFREEVKALETQLTSIRIRAVDIIIGTGIRLGRNRQSS